MKQKLLFGLFLSIAIVFTSYGQQLENAGFEDWEDAGTVIDEPVNWSSIKTSDNELLNPLAPVVWGQDTDAHSGSYSVKLFNVGAMSIIATGTLTNGRVHSDLNPDNGYVFTDTNDARWNTPLTLRPDSIVGWFKYYPQGNDVARVKALIHKGYATIPEKGTFSNWIAVADFISEPVLVDTWTRFSVPFIYYNSETPEYILLTLNSGDSTIPVEGSIALYDDLELIYNSGGIVENQKGNINIYSWHNTVVVDWIVQNFNKNPDIKIYDLSGRLVFTDHIFPNQKNIIHVNIPKGIYICEIQGASWVFTQKLFIQ